jgi:hypothetical protein
MMRVSQGDQRKPTREMGMSRIGDLDLVQRFFRWVVEEGIKLWDRSTGSTLIG